MADCTDREVASGGEASHKQTSNMGHSAGKGEKLVELRKRMEEVRHRIITYMDNKKEMEILRDKALFWEKLEMTAYMKAEKEAEASRRMERLKMLKSKQENSQERVKPDAILQHWPGSKPNLPGDWID